MCYTLPKIWMGRIQKYWDRLIPSDFPQSSSVFSISFPDVAVAKAVEKMENEIGTSESVVNPFVPENKAISNYVGTYNVEGEPGVLTLLNPNPVKSGSIVALHLNEDTKEWEDITDAHVVDGYAWGTVSSFSPIAVFEIKPEIYYVESDHIIKFPAIVCMGNAVQIKMNDNNKPVVVNPSTGKEFEITTRTAIVGGSIDGTPIDSTSISIVDLDDSAATLVRVYAGSTFYDETTPTKSATVNKINVNVINSKIYGITGSMGAVRTNEFNAYVENSTLKSHIACGEATISKLGKDANGTPNPTFASPAWVKNSNIVIKDSKIYVTYAGGNSGYLYVDNANLTVDGLTPYGSNDYFSTSNSNGFAKKVTTVINNSDLRHISCTNRGGVGSVDITVTNSKVDNFYIGGDNSEGDVDGTIESLKINVNAGEGSYNFKLGVDGTANIKSDKVESVKVSRNAGNVVVTNEVISVLGDKYIVK